MDTKKVDYYADLYPGWQHSNWPPCLMQIPHQTKSPGTLRVRVTVEFPTIPPGIDVHAAAESEIVNEPANARA